MPRFREEPIAPLLGTTLMEVLRDDLHHGVVDLALEEMHRWLVDNPETFARVLGERAPWWAPPKLNDAVTARIHLEAIAWVEDIRDDPHHRAREALDSMLGPARPRPAQRQPRPRRAPRRSRCACSTTRRSSPRRSRCGRRCARPCSARSATARVPCASGCSTSSTSSPSGCREDAALRERLDRTAADLTVFLVERYGAELTTVITSTIERWDGKEAARRIELHVGRDLQFIRINGTIVGGLVGVVIHAVSLLVH